MSSSVVETPIVVARHRENVVVGGEIVRHRRASRLIHWSVALELSWLTKAERSEPLLGCVGPWFLEVPVPPSIL